MSEKKMLKHCPECGGVIFMSQPHVSFGNWKAIITVNYLCYGCNHFEAIGFETDDWSKWQEQAIEHWNKFCDEKQSKKEKDRYCNRCRNSKRNSKRNRDHWKCNIMAKVKCEDGNWQSPNVSAWHCCKNFERRTPEEQAEMDFFGNKKCYDCMLFEKQMSTCHFGSASKSFIDKSKNGYKCPHFIKK